MGMGSDDVDSMTSGSSSGSSSRWKDSSAAKSMRAGGRAASASGESMISDSGREAASNIHAVSFKRGGKTRKDGVANLHKSERVIPANKRKKVEKLMKREKMTLTNRKGKKRAKRSSGRG